MLLIDYKPIDFTGKAEGNSRQPHKLPCTWVDVVWAAVMVGHTQVPLAIQPQAYAYLELLHRISSVYAFLQNADYRPGLWGALDTHLTQSPIYQDLDPAEKSTVSIFVGLMGAKLFAAKLLHTPWLFNLTINGQAAGVLGLTQEFQWLAMGIKGRSNRLDPRLIKKAIKLTPRLVIAGVPLEQQMGFFSYFTAVTKTLRAYLINIPHSVNQNNLTLNLSPNRFLRAYYALIFDFLSADYRDQANSITFADRAYRVKNIPEINGRIGLDEQVYDLIKSGQPLTQNFLSHLAEVATQPDAHNESNLQTAVISDGVFIQLGESWGDQRMHLPPAERLP
jgi:hypothetical protein